MPTAPTTSRGSLHPLLVGMIDLAGSGWPPYPGGRPCGALCVPAWSGTRMQPSTAPLATARGALQANAFDPDLTARAAMSP